MDDPMTRSRLDWVTGTRPIGAPDPKRGPHLFLRHCFRAAGVPPALFRSKPSENSHYRRSVVIN